jgi:hypothetical protein
MTVRISGYRETVTLHCTICGEIKNVVCDNVRKSYKEINAFRGQHEHLEQYKKRKVRI